MADSIQSLINQLGSMSYKAPSDVGYKSSYKNSKYKAINLAPFNLKASDFVSLAKPAAPPKVNLKPNIFDVLSGTLGQPSGFVTNSIYNAIHDIQKDKGSIGKKIVDFIKYNHGLPSLSDIVTQGIGNEISNIAHGKFNPFSGFIQSAKDNLNHNELLKSGVQGLENAAKGQWGDWTDGQFTLGDIPLVGALHGMDQGWKRGVNIAHDEIGIKNPLGSSLAGLGIDIAADPLTYLTGGMSAASKAGDAAKIAKMAELGKGLGLTKKYKSVDDFLNDAKSALQAKYAKYPNMAKSMVQHSMKNITNDVLADPMRLTNKLVDQQYNKLASSIEKARTQAINKNINKIGFGIPFTNKMALTDMANPVVKIGGKEIHLNPIYRTEATLGHDYAHVAENALADHGITDAAHQKAILKAAFGKSKAADLTKSEASALHDALTAASEKLAAHNKSLKNLPEAVVSEVNKLKPLDHITASPSLNVVRNALGDGLDHMPPREVEKVLKQVNEIKVGNKNLGKKDILDFIEKPHAQTEAKTNFEHFLDKHNPFDARTLKTGDKFLNTMAEHIQDANSAIVGNKAKYTMGLHSIQNFIKKNKMTAQEMKEAIYHLEGKAPKSYGKDWKASDRVKGLADKIRPVLDQVAHDETASGSLNKLLKNYFPHVVNKSPEELKKIQEFMKRHASVTNVSAENKFNRSRKGFETIADAENYMKHLDNAIQNAKDSDTIESLKAHKADVENLFDTNVVSALTRRIQEGVRAGAMKELQGNLKKFGMMVSNPDDISKLKTDGLVQMDKSTARKFGLDTNSKHYIQHEVLNGLKKIDQIFTHEGMNKFVRHITAVSDFWRPLVTTYKPSHYINNILGNVFNNIAAGVKVNDYKKAFKLMKGYRSGKLTDQQMKFMDQAFKHNVLSGGFLFDAHQTFHFDNPSKMEQLAKKLNTNKVATGIRMKLGEYPDDITRLANFINGFEKTGKIAKAAKQTREYLFNYNELTNADRAMRVVLPFWNWTKRSIPLMMKQAMENPKFPLNMDRVQQAFNNGQQGKDWQKQTGIKVPFANYYTTVPSPVQDLNTVLNPLNILGGLNPALKMPIELDTNKKLFTGNPITYGSNDVSPNDLASYLASNLGPVNDLYNLLSGKKSIGLSLLNALHSTSKINQVGATTGGN